MYFSYPSGWAPLLIALTMLYSSAFFSPRFNQHRQMAPYQVVAMCLWSRDFLYPCCVMWYMLAWKHCHRSPFIIHSVILGNDRFNFRLINVLFFVTLPPYHCACVNEKKFTLPWQFDFQQGGLFECYQLVVGRKKGQPTSQEIYSWNSYKFLGFFSFFLIIFHLIFDDYILNIFFRRFSIIIFLFCLK